ncbi:Amidase domain-containing protein [Madurella fahalii]|uniref:Amidase domain-containing protein n=1 Tax=Madurella fahalii TaxID=1157608 RepID=A0ABQ0FYL6_9PEZI
MLGSSLCRAFPLLSAALCLAKDGSAAVSDSNSFPLLIEAGLEDLASGLESGLFTSVDLVNAYIARINEVNSTLRMVTQINPDALLIAADLDAARAAGTSHGPLHGIPILLKDSIATDDKMENTAGSYALLGARVPEDSTVVAKLREAGAVILGKTSLSQWAHFRSLNTSNGWSAIGGQTEGAYFPRQDPSGSSSGSGVASSLGLALAALGTETHGSILGPASSNNLVGIKPTVGLTSRYLVVPISEHQDTIGPIARSVKDAAYVLSAIAGVDPKDNYTSVIPFETIPDYVAACDPSALSGKRIGVPRNLIDPRSPLVDPIIAAFNAALETLREANATVIDDLILPGYEPVTRGNFERYVVGADSVTNLAGYFSQLTTNPHNITSLAELRSFTQSHPLEAWPERDTLLWDEVLSIGHGNNDSPFFWSNYTAQLYFAGPLGITGALANHSLDALVLPTYFAPALPAMIGAPVVTVPLGKFSESTPVAWNGFGNLVVMAPNVPFGISFLGERFSEERLIGLAYAFEQRTKVRATVEPYIKPETELADVVTRRMAMAATQEGGSVIRFAFNGVVLAVCFLWFVFIY